MATGGGDDRRPERYFDDNNKDKSSSSNHKPGRIMRRRNAVDGIERGTNGHSERSTPEHDSASSGRSQLEDISSASASTSGVQSSNTLPVEQDRPCESVLDPERCQSRSTDNSEGTSLLSELSPMDSEDDTTSEKLKEGSAETLGASFLASETAEENILRADTCENPDVCPGIRICSNCQDLGLVVQSETLNTCPNCERTCSSCRSKKKK